MSKKKSRLYDNTNESSYKTIEIHEENDDGKFSLQSFLDFISKIGNFGTIEAIIRRPSDLIMSLKINKNDIMSDCITNAVVGRLDAIPTKEDIVIDEPDLKSVPFTSYGGNYWDTINNLCLANASTINNPTIVVPIRKDKVTNKLWDYGEIISDLSSVSVLYAMLINSKISNPSILDRWIGLNESVHSEYVNVAYIPNIPVFYEFNKNKKKDCKFVLFPVEKCYKMNVLFVSVPSRADAKPGLEKMSKSEYSDRVICRMMDAVVKCGCKRLIIAPFAYKDLFKADKRTIADTWKRVLTLQNAIVNIDDVSFIFEDDNEKKVFDNI